jgi:hypothetical protein
MVLLATFCTLDIIRIADLSSNDKAFAAGTVLRSAVRAYLREIALVGVSPKSAGHRYN